MSLTSSPLPGYFGAPDAALFGWLHASPPQAQRDLGVVVCAPFGFEEVCAHRSLLHLATATAAAGLPTVRFDLAGCGNSAGDASLPDSLGAWTRSVHSAIEFLKASTGVRQVCLIGIRLGAALATRAAVEREDVLGLVAVAPVVRGRDYIRELRMLGQSTTSGAAASAHTDGTLETAGFVMSGETAEAVRKLDLRKLDKRPAQHVLLIGRDDLPEDIPWAQDLTQLGADVAVQTWPGFAAVMTNPQDAQVPQLMIDGIVSTLTAWSPTVMSPAMPAPSSHASNAMRIKVVRPDGEMTVIEESIERIGIDADGAALFGIATRPVGGPRAPDGVLMLNSGSVHHIGPNRLWVTLARAWAARGIVSMRVDLSGIGDSPTRQGERENHVYTTVAPQDVVDALAHLKRMRGVARSHLLGLCSGAFHAQKAVIDGHGVTSAVMVNPLAYDWASVSGLESGPKEYEVLELSSRYRQRLFSAEPWLRLIRGDLNVRMIAGVFAKRLGGIVARQWSRVRRLGGSAAPEGVAGELSRALQHGVALHFVFAAGDPGHPLLLLQGSKPLEVLVDEQHVSIDIIDNADHTFTTIDARSRLVSALERMLGIEAATC